VLLQSQLDVSNIVVMLVILPLSYFVAMYMYLGIRELKHDSRQIMSVFKERLAIKETQIRQHQIIIKSLHEKIDELTVIKRELPFTDIVPYVNMEVGVFYGNGYIETYITKILDEKVTKYRCYKCGNRKYLLGELELLV
jgi:hypothetical protein